MTAPAWTSYSGEARRMIAAVRAMGLLECRAPTQEAQQRVGALNRPGFPGGS